MIKASAWLATLSALAVLAVTQQVLKRHPKKFPVTKSEAEWRRILTPNQFHILRQSGTEPSFQNAYWNNKQKGVYLCAATKQPLFSSDDKFDSKTGWPSFTKPLKPGLVLLVEDLSMGMRRVEVIDALSGSHLGHVFDDGPAPTGKRYCMNSAALIFVPERR